MKRECAVCSRPYEAQRSTSRYCSGACRAKASTWRQRGVEVNSDAESGRPPVDRALSNTVRRKIVEAGRLTTARAAQAVMLAMRLEDSVADSGAAVVALSRELDRVMTELLGDVPGEPDVLDRLVADVAGIRTRQLRSLR